VIKGLYLQWVLDKCLSKGVNRIFDAGCGRSAQYALLLARRYRSINFAGVDLNIDENFAGQLNNRVSNAAFFKGDLLNLKWKGHFEIVYTIDVLEHIQDYKQCLKNLTESLKETGKIIIHVPNKEQKRYFFKSERYISSAYSQTKKGDEHIREGFEKTDLENELRRAGLRIIKSIYTFGFPLSFIKELFNWSEKKHLGGTGIVLLPITIIFWSLEIIFGCKKGNGILIVAAKG